MLKVIKFNQRQTALLKFNKINKIKLFRFRQNSFIIMHKLHKSIRIKQKIQKNIINATLLTKFKNYLQNKAQYQTPEEQEDTEEDRLRDK